MLPFTPRRRDNLASWMVARSDGEHYGKLQVFQFPKQTLVFGPQQVVARINQDQVISPQITLWNQQGSQVIQGTLMVIPIEESLIYVRPLYLRAQAGRIPELTRVIVAYQNRIVMEPTLDAATGAAVLARGGRRPQGGHRGLPAGARPTAPPRRRRVRSGRRRHRRTREPCARPGRAGRACRQVRWRPRRRPPTSARIAAQRAGDWATYGAEIARLGQILERLAQPPR